MIYARVRPVSFDRGCLLAVAAEIPCKHFSRAVFRNSAASTRPVDRDLFIRFAAR